MDWNARRRFEIAELKKRLNSAMLELERIERRRMARRVICHGRPIGENSVAFHVANAIWKKSEKAQKESA